jgi:hypothetical protein
MKVIGIGLNKTGTKSLGASLRILGFNHFRWSPEPFDVYLRQGFSGLLSTLHRYDSFEDWPWPLVYREVDKAFPCSKFILTKRQSADIWYQSLCKHALRTGPTLIRQHIYGHAMPQGHRQEYLLYYENHIHAARDYFARRPHDILEVCWENGDGWREIGTFLGLGVPGTPFPHENQSSRKGTETGPHVSDRSRDPRHGR